MQDFRVAEARARFGELLDRAESGEGVFIERRGVRFSLQAEPHPKVSSTRPPVFSYVDDTLLQGEWTWGWTTRGIAFRPRRKAR
ncbi:MAG: type II toxin-antitoxin system Phd/YefM family antitoxin [Vicinamibacterales bacterium]